MAKTAKEILTQENFTSGTPEAEVQEMLLAWLEYDESAAELIAKHPKDTVKGAFNAIRNAASKKKGGSGAVAMNPRESMEAMMVHFGMKKDEADAALEGGLMYYILMTTMEKWKPYGAEKTQPMPKPQPVADLPKNKIPDSSFSLKDFSLEDML